MVGSSASTGISIFLICLVLELAAPWTAVINSREQENQAITMIIILKHPPSHAPTPPTKQGSLTLGDLEMAQSREAEE